MHESNERFELPGAMDEKLRRVRGRLSSIGLATAAAVGFAVLLGAMLLAMLIDHLATLYDSSWRSVLTNSALVAAGLVLVGWAVLACLRWRRLSTVAREVDRRTPHLEERWAIVAEHAESGGHADNAAAHPAVLRRVAEEAHRRGVSVAPREVASLDGLIRAFLAVNAVTVVLVLAAVLDWRQTNVLLRRFWAPGANISATTIVARPGDAVVGRGEPLTLVAALGGTPVETARLAILHPDEDEQQVTLVPRPADTNASDADTLLTASHRLRKVEDSFRYRFRAGDGQTEWSEVTVADRPSIAEARLRVTPPDYRKEKAKTFNKMPRRVSIVAGTQVELGVKPQGNVTSLRLDMGEGVSQTLSPDADGWYRWRGAPDKTLTLSPILTEEHGLTNRRPSVTQLRVYPDRPPVVRVLTPEDELAVTAGDTVDISFIAEDDNGIGAAELVIYCHSDDPVERAMAPSESKDGQVEIERIPIALDADQGNRVQGRVSLDLSKYQLQDGASLSYEVRVTEQRSPRVEAADDPLVLEQQKPSEQGRAAAGPADQADAQPLETDQATANLNPQQPKQPAGSPTASPQSDKPSADPQATGANQPSPNAAQSTPSPGDRRVKNKAAGKVRVRSDQDPAIPNVEDTKPSADADKSSVPRAADNPALNEKSAGNNADKNETATPTRPDREASSAANDASPAAQPTKPKPGKSEPGKPERGKPEPGKSEEQTPAKPDPAAAPKADAAEEQPAQPNATPPGLRPPGIGPPMPQGLPSVGPASNGAAPKATDGKKNRNANQSKAKPGQGGAAPSSGQQRPDKNRGGQQPSNLDGNRSTTSKQRSLVAAPQGDPSVNDPAKSRNDDRSSKRMDSKPPAPKTPQPSSNQNGQQRNSNRGDSAPNRRDQPAANQSSSNQASGNQNGDHSPKARQNREAKPSNENASRQKRSSGNASPPSDGMTRRQSDLAQQAQSGTSNAMRVTIDKNAGSFAGQQRRKLELVLAPDVAKFASHLKRAEKLTRSVLDQLDSGESWSPRRHRDVTTGEGEVRQAQAIAASIRKRTRGTVYAFVGLQIGDIAATNLAPAREHLWQAHQSGAAERVELVRRGWRQTRRALDRLERLIERFEAARQEHQLADRAELVKKRYRVFVEDVHTRLGVQPGEGSKHRRKMAEFELDEEYLQRLTEVLKMRQELYAELARILDDDPRLLRRFMNNFRDQTGSLLKQMEDLRLRQERLARDTNAWANSQGGSQEKVLAALRQLRLDESSDLAQQAGDLAERFEAWLPFEAARDGLAGDRAADPVAEARSIAEAAASHGQELAQAAGRGDTDLAIAEAEALYQTLRDFEVAARRLGGGLDVEGIEQFAVRRILDSRRLVTGVSSWLRRVREIDQGAFHRAAAIEQYQLASDTDQIAAKLGGVEQGLAQMLQTPDGNLPSHIADPARRLLMVLDEQATPNQLGAAIALQQPDWARVATRQDAAVTAMAEAERLFNEMIAAAIKELDKLPVQDPIASLLDDPTLDQILAQLQSERDLAEELGIPQRPSNLQQIGDWLNPNQRGGQNGYGGNRGKLLARIRSEMQRMNRLSDQMRKDALDRIKSKKKIASVQRPMAKPQKTETAKAKPTDWNKLLSQLDSGLLQGRDKLPPQEYRSAIKRYYEIVNRRATEAAERPATQP